VSKLDYTPTVPAMIRALAERFGDKAMLVDGTSRLTFAEAESRSARLAIGLLADGVGKGTRVGLLMANGADWLIAWLAAARIGAIVVPVNTFSQPRELGWMLRHADVDTLLCHPRFLSHDYLARLEEIAPELVGAETEPLFLPSLPHLRRVRVFGTCDRAWAREAWERSSELARTLPRVDDDLLRAVEACVSPADAVAIIYSSGSTADPKGAVHSHGGMIRYARNMVSVRDIREDDIVWAGMPFFWVGGLVYALLTPVMAGATLLNQPSFDPAEALDFMEREHATLAIGWPLSAKAMAEDASFAGRDLSSLRGGNLYAILPEAIRPLDAELRSNPLGMTETCGPHCYYDLEVELPEVLRGSAGQPVPGVEHRIVDPDTSQLAAPDTVGEICIRGASLMQGLYKVEREDTFDSDGFYHTGDMGRFGHEGHLFFTGRGGDMIKTAGANVAPREVEIAFEALPDVLQAHVVGVADPDRGQLVVAAVALREGAQATAKTLREQVRGELSSYKVPRHVLLFDVKDLPFTDSGKIDKRGLQLSVSRRLEVAAAG